MKRIVYDSQAFVEQRYGGISRYFCELAARVHRAPGHAARVIAPLHINSYLPACDVPKDALHLRRPFRGQRTVCNVANALLAPLLTRLHAPSLIHRTYYTPAPRSGRVPVVVTAFDMIHELFPAQFGPDDAVLRDKRAGIAAADHVVCISESTARDLMRLFNVPADKVSVTHLGFSADLFGPVRALGEQPPHPRPYLLHVGQRGGYKNFEATLRAYVTSPQLAASFDLVAFGGPPFDAGEQALISRLAPRAGAVRRLGGSDADLARAYRHAHAFVYPSRYEGFGIPPLEAMASGCVVACANTSSIPEVVGDAAALFDPDDPDAIRAALDTACFDEGARARLRAAAAARVAHFTWDRCAEATLRVYDRLLRG